MTAMKGIQALSFRMNVVILSAMVLSILTGDHSFLQPALATNTPTGQPTGLPTSTPTLAPTSVYQPEISLNVTLLLHEVNPTLFNEDFETCTYAIQHTLAQALDIKQEDIVVKNDEMELYENQIYDYNSMNAVVSKEFLDGTDSVINLFGGRRLSRTHGSRGITVNLALSANPHRMGFLDNDLAYFAIVNELKDTIRTHALTGFMRDQSFLAGCSSLAAMEGITPAFISNTYESTVYRSSAPTSFPTQVFAHRMRNRAGIIAGVLLGATAFILAVFAIVYTKVISFDFGVSVSEQRAQEGAQTVADEATGV
jgi:hypothetical protein